jgi:hypothetical protein
MKPYLLIAQFAFIVITSFLTGCATLGSGASGGLAQVDDAQTGNNSTLPVAVDVRGKAAVLYVNKDNRITLAHEGSKKLLDKTARVQGGRYMQLFREGDDVSAMWWSHEEGKKIYFARSRDLGETFETPVAVNDAFGVLPPYQLLRHAGGAIGVIYADERHNGHQVYFNRSLDKGSTWGKPDVRLDTAPSGNLKSDAREPKAVSVGEAWVVAWVDALRTPEHNAYRILSRRSTDAGLTWSPAQTIYSTDRFISSFTLSGDSKTVVFVVDEFKHGVVGGVSNDAGETWKVLGVAPGTEASENGGFKLTVGQGRAYAVWMHDPVGAKTQILLGELDTLNPQWVRSTRRMDVKPVEGSKSLQGDIVALANGVVVASWQDFRNIRASVYLSASFDAGATWTEPQSISNPGMVFAGRPQLMRWGDGVALRYEVYPSDKVLEGRFLLQKIELDAARKRILGLYETPAMNESKRKSRLQERVNQLWTSRLNRDYDTGYDFFDFAYKAAYPKKDYLMTAGGINYHTFSVLGVTMQGNEANVKMKFKYDVPKTMLPSGRTVEVKPVEVDAENAWVWVGDDWYLIFKPSYEAAVLNY